MEEDKYIEGNKKLWNGKTPIHIKSDFYDVEGFKKGKSSLNFPEIEALGDVKGKSILNLQCHFGMHTMSLARLGANATGIDFSNKAIDYAKELNDELGLDAEFICTNIYDLKEKLDKKFDIVYTSYGVLCWLPDLDRWADIISYFIKPGGMFIMVEYHPVVLMFDEKFENLYYSYFNRGVIIEHQQGTYAQKDAEIKQLSYEWSHSMSEIFTSLLKHGMKIVSFKEYPYSIDNCFNKMVKREHGFWEIEGHEDIIPLMYSIKAVKDINQL